MVGMLLICQTPSLIGRHRRFAITNNIDSVMSMSNTVNEGNLDYVKSLRMPCRGIVHLVDTILAFMLECERTTRER
jgi:hypothetical protein